jgi:methylmalonyl-CoA mutase cobalamin-binding subunit
MALTLEEVMAEIDRIKEEYAREDPDNTAQAISTFMLDNEVPEDLYRNAMSKVNEANYRGIAQSGLARGETAGGDGTGVVKLTPIRSGEGVTYSNIPDQYTLADVQVAGRPMMDQTQLSQYLPYDPYDTVQRRAYEVAGPRAVTFYDRILNRPVPVISKGVDALGRPTTGITMGDAALAPSGEMTISSLFPGTGMNIEGSGLGGTTVGLSGQQAVTAGLPPGNTTGTLLTSTGDLFTTVDGVKTVDEVLGTTGGTSGTGDTFVTDGSGNVVGSQGGTACPIVNGVQYVTNAAGQCVHPDEVGTTITGGDPNVCPVIGGVQYVKDASGNCVDPATLVVVDDKPKTKTCWDGSVVGINDACPLTPQEVNAQNLQNIYNTSANTDVAAQRIGDYAASVGGLSGQEIADAINPVISTAGPNLLDPGTTLTAADVARGAQESNVNISGLSTLPEDPMARLTSLYSQDQAAGAGPYTTLESAYRVLDEGARQGLTLDQIGAAFNLGAGQAAKVLGDVGIDVSGYDSSKPYTGISAAAPSNVYATGIGSLQAGQSAVPTIQQNLAAMYDPTQKGTAAEAQTAQQILAQGAAAGLNLNQIGASFGLSPEQTRQELIRAGLDTSVIPGFQKGGAVDTGDQGNGFFSSVGRGISGLARYAKDKMFGEVPEYMADTSEIRFSGRPGSAYREEYYGEGPTFEERLIREYGYPESPERPGSADFSRESRPTGRMDMPATSEILDARAHALGTALYGNEYGGEASTAMGVMGEEYDRTFDNASREDIAMDTRNNAVGRKILRNAGIMNTTRDLTRMVDQKILDQLDRIMDRPIEERRAESPKEGPDLYFSRLDPKTLKTTTDPRGIVNATNYSRHPGGI